MEAEMRPVASVGQVEYDQSGGQLLLGPFPAGSLCLRLLFGLQETVVTANSTRHRVQVRVGDGPANPQSVSAVFEEASPVHALAVNMGTLNPGTFEVAIGVKTSPMKTFEIPMNVKFTHSKRWVGVKFETDELTSVVVGYVAADVTMPETFFQIATRAGDANE